MLENIGYKNYIYESTKALKQQGIIVVWGDDFDEYGEIIAQRSERYPPALSFRHEEGAPEKLDGIWLIAFRGNGELVHTQACRNVSILPNMQEHLQTRAHDYNTENFQFDVAQIDVNLSPQAKNISGNAIYHGEAWSKGGPTGIRGDSAIYILSRLMMAKVLMHWGAEYIYGMIPPIAGVKGLAQRYGYTRCEQGAVTFTDLKTFPNDLWFVWMTAEEARLQLRLSPQYFHEMVASSQERAVGKVA